MSEWRLKAPIAVIVFNRPDATRQVFERISKVRPSQLFVIADGPRADRPGEKQLCQEVRAIFDRIDWTCEVHRNYSDINLSCDQRVQSGLDWVFDQVEEAIILEDDVLADVSFFRYCDELLARYRVDTRIMAINGTNYLKEHERTGASYRYSYFFDCWGWATWRRAWQLHDPERRDWSEVKSDGWLRDIIGDDLRAVRYWELMLDKSDLIWDFVFQFTIWINSGLTIVPERNLITNIGFGSDAAHTINADDAFSRVRSHPIEFPLTHPPFVVRDSVADASFQRLRFTKEESIRDRLVSFKYNVQKALFQR